MHHSAMPVPGSYEDAVESFDDINDETRKRLVRDSSGAYHTLEQTKWVFLAFDTLTGLTSMKEGQPYRPNFEKSRDIMDEAVAEALRTGFPINLCFQTVVMNRDRAAMEEEVRRENEAEERARRNKQ